MTEVCSRISAESNQADTLIHHLYLWEGLFIIVFNALLMIIILKEEKLRAQKEFSLYAGCLVFEVLFGVTYAVAGAYRLGVHYSNEYFPLHNAFGCLIQPHVLLFVYITPCVGFLVFIISLDRFISVFLPTRYMMFSHRYVCFMFLLVVLMPVPLLVVSFATTAQLPGVPTITECGLNSATTEQVYITLRVTRVIFSLLGALLYIPIIFRIRMFCSASSRRILRTTMTVLLISLSTLSLYTIPDIVLLINPHYPSKFFYGVVNVFIFLFTQRTIRDAVIQALKRSHWKQPSTISWKKEAATILTPPRPESVMSKKDMGSDK